MKYWSIGGKPQVAQIRANKICKKRAKNGKDRTGRKKAFVIHVYTYTHKNIKKHKYDSSFIILID